MNMEYEEGSLFLDTAHLKREFVAGGIAGAIGIFVGFPLDLVKVNLQVYPEKYKSPIHCFRSIIKENGFKGLYRGCMPPILTQGLINSMLFAGEATAMKYLQPDLKRGELGTPINTFLAGCFGGVVQTVVLVPADVVKCTMQATESASSSSAVQQNVFKETMSCIKNIYLAEGIRGLYKGYLMTITREVPSIGLYFFSYKNIRDQITRLQNLEAPNTFATLLAGGCAGAISWAIIYPADVMKTYMQISTAPVGGDALAYKDMKMKDVAVTLYRRHGFRVFFAGLGTTVVRAFPVNAVVFYFYELISDYLHLK